MITKIRRKLAKAIYRGMVIENYFNVPFKFESAEAYAVNERIVEIPFVLSELKDNKEKLKILDFGCTNSWLPISLASLGHDVYGVDLRDYHFKHPNFVFKKQNILTLEEKGFDVIIAVSSLEHVGLKAYGAKEESSALNKILSKINGLLADQGKLILTVPVGEPSEDDFMRSFAPEEIENMIITHDFTLEMNHYFYRVNYQHWLPCTRGKIKEVSNRMDENITPRCGVNGIGCYVFRK